MGEDDEIKANLKNALIMAAGPEPDAQARMLRKYSEFLPEADQPIFAVDVDRMSGKWAVVTLERLLDAVKDGQEHFHWNEKGVKIQLGLFD